METTYLLVGGDRRQFWLSRLLLDRGRVYTLGVPGLEDTRPEVPAELLILPTPCLDGEGRLRRAAGEGLDPACLAGLCGPQTRVYGGALPAGLRSLLPPCGQISDLLADPGVAAVNGRLTAEAALALAEERMEGSLFGRPCLVLGYGRIGKPLAALLRGRHAAVTVAARRPGVRAEAAQSGCEVCDFTALRRSFSAVFNTVPAAALSAAALRALGPDCLWVELASAPGGLPALCHPDFPVLPAASLPGRCLPRSAAAALLEGILRREEGQ